MLSDYEMKELHNRFLALAAKENYTLTLSRKQVDYLVNLTRSHINFCAMLYRNERRI